MPTEKSWDDMTRQERADLLLRDPEKYIELVPEEHWLLLLDGIQNLPPYEPPK